jgi:hypothetical protein
MLRLKRMLACALGLVLASSSPGVFAQWREQGPGPTLNGQTEGLPGNPVSGSVNAIAVDYSHPGVVYLATTNGGVWKSTNANSSAPNWTPLTDLKLPALSLNSIAISPLDSRVIFAGTGSTSSDAFEGSAGFGVARSTDGGANWTVLAGTTFAGRRINSIVPLARTSGGLWGQTVLAATLFDGGGVYRSVNGGTSFARVSGTGGLPDAGVSSLANDPWNSARLYAAVPASFGGGTGAGIYRSDNAGVSWTPVNIGLTGLGTSLRILLSVGRKTGVVNAMVINTNGMLTGVFRSSNGGATWTALGVPTPPIFPGGQGVVHGAIAADPVNPNIVYIAGDRQDVPFPNANGCSNFSANVFRGDASLASPWQNVVCSGAQGTSPHADSRDMEFDTYGNLLQANDGGIYRLNQPDQASRQWVSLNNNIRPTEIHSVAFDGVTHTAFAGTQDTGTPMQNAPGSFTWTEFLQGDGGVVEVDDKSGGGGSSIRYTSFQFLGFFNRSTWSASNTLISGPTQLGLQIVSGPGAGQNLYQFDPNIQFYNPYVLNAIDPTRMLLGTANIYESRDRGDTLADLTSTGKFIASLAYGSRLNGTPKPDVFYVGTAGTGRPYILHRVSAGGAITELASYPGTGVRDLVMDRQNYRKLYVVDEQNRVWATFDEGAHWYNLTANLPNYLAQARTIELINSTGYGRDTVLVVGGLGGVVQLHNPGTGTSIWSRLGTNLPHGLVLDLRYNVANDVLVAGILGRGAWTLSGFAGGYRVMEWSSATAGSDAATEPLLTLPAGLPNIAPAIRNSGSAAPVNVQ